MLPNATQANSISFFAGEVLGVNYTDLNPNNMYSIRVKLVSNRTAGTGDTITARPMDSNMKKIPLIGEIAIVFKGPSNDSVSSGNLQNWYYISTLNVQNSIQQNALPDRSKSAPTGDPNANSKNYNESADGNPNISQDKTIKQAILGANFIEQDNLKPIQPFEGDILMESRFGSSLRFGSTWKKNSAVFSKESPWGADASNEGDPITIISNGHGQSSDQGFNNFKTEDINLDASSIWLTKGQAVNLETVVKDSDQKAISEENNNSYKSGFTGDQILLTSDRLVFNARKDEVAMFANNGLSFGTNGSLAVDAKDGIHLNASYINLGLNPNEPAVLGDTLVRILSDLISQIQQITVPTGTGPSGIPLNSPMFSAISQRLVTCLSETVAVK